MRKLHVAMLSSVALVAFSALVGTASAETTLLAEWLVGGVGVTELTSTEAAGAVILRDAKIGLEMECSGVADGSVGVNGESETTELLVGSTPVSLTKPAVCKGIGGCSAPAEAAPENLPWHGQLFLTEGGLFRGAKSRGTYWSMCTVLGFLVEEECTLTNATAELLNVTGGVEVMGEATPLGECTTGGKEAAAITAVAGNLGKTLTGTLTVSE